MACQFCGASQSGDSCAIGCYTGANTIKRESFELWLVPQRQSHACFQEDQTMTKRPKCKTQDLRTLVFQHPRSE